MSGGAVANPALDNNFNNDINKQVDDDLLGNNELDATTGGACNQVNSNNIDNNDEAKGLHQT